MPRFLGIDYGTRRIGLAVSDPEATLALPVTTIASRARVADNVAAVAAVADEYQVDAFVLGLPLNMDDTEGEQAKITRAFGRRLRRQTGLPVHFCDERLSSFAAKELLQTTELTRGKKKKRVDRLAAQVMLQSFLDQRSED